MAPVRIDLHVHSSASDGSDPPAEVMRRAGQAGLDVVALTDHDTTAGLPQARAALPPGLTLLTGMELSCRIDADSIHLLAYQFDTEDSELAAETELIRDDRIGRAQAMVTRLIDLGAPVTWEDVLTIAGDSVVGRPHIARALAAAGVVATPAEAFTQEWIGDGGRAYVPKHAPTPEHAIALVRQAGGVTVLAHPRSPGYEVSDQVIAGLAAVGLAGLEIAHPDHDQTSRVRLTALATELGLVGTGGSDDHGDLTGYQLGRETTSQEALERLLTLGKGAL